MLPLPSVFAWSVAPTDLPAAVLSPWILWHLREIRPGIVVTEFCCHFFMLNFKLLFNWFRAKISLSCKVFILQTTVLTGLSTREFRTYNLWQIASIIEICLGFQKSFTPKDTLSIVWSYCRKVLDVALLHRFEPFHILNLGLVLHRVIVQIHISDSLSAGGLCS